MELGFQVFWGHLALFIDGDGRYCFATEAEHLGRFFNAVVAMGAGEECEFAAFGEVAVLFGVGKQRVAGNDDGGRVRCRAPLNGDASCVSSLQPKKVRKSFGH